MTRLSLSYSERASKVSGNGENHRRMESLAGDEKVLGHTVGQASEMERFAARIRHSRHVLSKFLYAISTGRSHRSSISRRGPRPIPSLDEPRRSRHLFGSGCDRQAQPATSGYPSGEQCPSLITRVVLPARSISLSEAAPALATITGSADRLILDSMRLAET